MNTQSYFILENIEKNFNKLLMNCTDTTFIPPTFATSNDITALIVLNQIIDLMYKKEKESTIQNEIIGVTLEQIIVIKCNDFCNWTAVSNRDFQNINNINSTDFINSFYNYVQTVATTIIDHYSQQVHETFHAMHY